MTGMTVNPALVRDIDAYLSHWRALGRRYRQQESLLHSLSRELPALGHSELTAESHTIWFESRKDRHPNTRRKWAEGLRHFCLFRRRLAPDCFVPGPELACRRQPYVTPVIVGDDQVASLLTAAGGLAHDPVSPLRSATMRIAIVLLYTTGIRFGELLRLTLGDVEDDSSVLRIRESKFKKTRLVPLSATARTEIRAFLERRAGAGFDAAAVAALLSARPGGTGGYSAAGLGCAIRALFRAASIADTYGRPPRIHDLRHSFAIQVLARAYRQGDDVQVLLPKLAMYMGHVSIESTAYYLRWCEELAALASARFESSFAHVVSGRPS